MKSEAGVQDEGAFWLDRATVWIGGTRYAAADIEVSGTGGWFDALALWREFDANFPA